MPAGSYRPRNPGHDYHGRGIYLITLVVKERRPLLGSLTAKIGREGVGREGVVLSPLGAVVAQMWEQTPAFQASHGNRILVHACVCMPDHFHGVIEVLEPMEWSLGDIMQAFKATCTRRWHEMQGLPKASERPLTIDSDSPELNLP